MEVANGRVTIKIEGSPREWKIPFYEGCDYGHASTVNYLLERHALHYNDPLIRQRVLIGHYQFELPKKQENEKVATVND